MDPTNLGNGKTNLGNGNYSGVTVVPANLNEVLLQPLYPVQLDVRVVVGVEGLVAGSTKTLATSKHRARVGINKYIVLRLKIHLIVSYLQK